MLVPVADESIHSGFQVCHAVEQAVAEDSFVNNAEEDFNLVDPGGMERCVVKAETMSVASVESFPSIVFTVFMNVEVIPDDVDFLLGKPTRHCFHEFNDIGDLSARPNFGINLSSMGI